MATITNTLLSMEQQIGYPSQTGTITPITDNVIKKRIISWCLIKGVWNVEKLSNDTLAKLYGLPNYLSTTLTNQSTGKNKYAPKPPTLTLDDDNNTSTHIPPRPSPITFDQHRALNTSSHPAPTASTQSIPQPSINLDQIKNQILKDLVPTLEKFQENINDQLSSLSKTLTTALKSQEENLQPVIEDMIFRFWINQKLKTAPQITNNPPTDSSPTDNLPPSETNPTSSNHSLFIPKLDPNYHFDTYATKVIRSALNMSENLYVYGDTGCGKTTHIEQVCAILDHGIIRINPHDGITREMFLGGMKLINNETIFVEGALPLAMKNGLVFLVDEISFLPPNLTAILNPIGEKGGKLYIPETSEWISPQPGFCIFATDNTGGKGDRTGNYTGTEVQNTATLDRFAFCLKMNYLPKEKEKEMLIKRFSNQSQDEIEKMLTLARDIRQAFSRGELAITLSTRKLIKFFDQRENNFTTQEALQNTILSWLDEDDETLIKTMIDRLDILKSSTLPKSSLSNQKIDLTNFVREVQNNRIINAIKELRNQAGTDASCYLKLGLRSAKELTESYRDSQITIQELEAKIINGDY